MDLHQTLVIVIVTAKHAPQALGATATTVEAQTTESAESFQVARKKRRMPWYPSRKNAIVGIKLAAETIQMAGTARMACNAKSTRCAALGMARSQMKHHVSAAPLTLGKHALRRTNCSVKT